MPDQSSPARSVAGRSLSDPRTGRRDRGRLASSRIAAFTEKLAHDLRTPVTVIQEYAALMRDGLVGDLNDEQRRILDVIADRAYDLNRVVDNAVDATRLAEKSHRIWGRPCGVRDIIARIRPQLERKAAIRCVDLQFGTIAERPDIHCDDEAVARAISNIVVAALNLSRDGCRMSISEELHPGLKEAGVRVTVESAGAEAIARLFRDLASVKHYKRESRASQLCETSLAAELLDRNLGRLAVKPLEAGATTLWIGLPIADPVEILHRHLARFTERRPGPQSVSFIRASICEPVDKELSRDVCSLLNSCIDRGDLAVELDRTRWLMAVFHRQVRTEAFQRRIERRRAAVNRKRLGRPLPQVSLRRLGTWNLPNDITQILAMVVSRVEQCAPADACAE